MAEGTVTVTLTISGTDFVVLSRKSYNELLFKLAKATARVSELDKEDSVVVTGSSLKDQFLSGVEKKLIEAAGKP